MDQYYTVKVLGLELGTCKTVDPIDDFVIQYGEFTSTYPGLESAECIVFDLADDNITTYDMNNEPNDVGKASTLLA